MLLAEPADVDARRAGRPRGVRDVGRRLAHAPRAGDVRASATSSSATSTSSRASSPPSTARCSTTPRARSSAGMEVVEYACGLPQLLKGEYSDQVSTDIDALLVPPAARRVRRDHAVQLPDHGPDVDAPDGDRDRQHVRAQALRARPVGRRTSSPSSTPRPACPTASSTSSTATRSPSTRCSTTPTSPPSRSSARRRSRATSTSARPPPASACRRSAGRRTTPS